MSDQTVKPRQTLTETWEITYTRRRAGEPIEARLFWPHYTIYAFHSGGETVEEARLALVHGLHEAIKQDSDLGREDKS